MLLLDMPRPVESAGSRLREVQDSVQMTASYLLSVFVFGTPPAPAAISPDSTAVTYRLIFRAPAARSLPGKRVENTYQVPSFLSTSSFCSLLAFEASVRSK